MFRLLHTILIFAILESGRMFSTKTKILIKSDLKIRYFFYHKVIMLSMRKSFPKIQIVKILWNLIEKSHLG